jgi:hypothetical protein
MEHKEVHARICLRKYEQPVSAESLDEAITKLGKPSSRLRINEKDVLEAFDRGDEVCYRHFAPSCYLLSYVEDGRNYSPSRFR